MDAVRSELADDPTIDITTTGRKSGRPRRIEIWMLDIDGRFVITGTPGSHLAGHWYRGQTPLDDLIVSAPMVEVAFEPQP